MHANRLLRFVGTIFVLGLTLILLGQPASAATVTWDSTVSGGPHDGTGSWTLSASNWWNSAADQLWNNANNDIAQFGTGSGGSTAYTVTLNHSTTANGLIFQNRAYSLNTNTLTLAGQRPRSLSTPAANNSSTLAGTAGLTTAGTGMLTLNAQNSYTGGTTVSGNPLLGGDNVIQGAGHDARGTVAPASTTGAWGTSLVTAITINGGTLYFRDRATAATMAARALVASR